MNKTRKTSQIPPLVLVAFLAACAPVRQGPPEIVLDQTPCSHCSMLISEPRYAAAYRVGGHDKVFDDIGCLLRELGADPGASGARLWFRDVRDGSWIDPDDATFVRASSLRTPMAGGIVATAHAAEVERLRGSMDAAVYTSFEALQTAYGATVASEPAPAGSRR